MKFSIAVICKILLFKFNLHLLYLLDIILPSFLYRQISKLKVWPGNSGMQMKLSVNENSIALHGEDLSKLFLMHFSDLWSEKPSV